ncbi:MAG: HAMP domain-containing sensor histidine kinase [Alphaproteobacteria bacterium]
MAYWALSDASLAAAAEARRSSLIMRGAFNAAFATSVALTTGQIWPAALWYAVVVALMCADVQAGQLFLRADDRKLSLYRGLFIASSVITISAFMGMALTGALHGGPEGRISAVFMATGSLVTLMVLMVEAPLFMVLSTVPGVICLLSIPMLPNTPAPVSANIATLGLYVTLGTFASQMIRTATQHMKLFRGLKTARDEAEQRRAEAEARRVEADQHRRAAEMANAAKSEFLCAMTHELRTPLNAVINYAEIIGEETQGVVAEDAQRITRSAKHLLELINRVLEFAMLDAGNLKLESATFSALDVLRDSLAAHQALIEANGNRARISPDDLDLVLTADRDRFRQCVDCLVSNAARFTTKGEITISAYIVSGAACFSVRDNGVGMDAEALEKAFEAFVQTDGSKTRGVDGLGLGLATARKIARAMGGDINAESTPGIGSCFELRVPLRLHRRAAA